MWKSKLNENGEDRGNTESSSSKKIRVYWRRTSTKEDSLEPPWMNNEIKEEIKERKKLNKKWWNTQ